MYIYQIIKIRSLEKKVILENCKHSDEIIEISKEILNYPEED